MWHLIIPASPPVLATNVVLPVDHVAVIPLAVAQVTEAGCTEVGKVMDYRANTDFPNVVIPFFTRSL